MGLSWQEEVGNRLLRPKTSCDATSWFRLLLPRVYVDRLEHFEFSCVAANSPNGDASLALFGTYRFCGDASLLR